MSQTAPALEADGPAQPRLAPLFLRVLPILLAHPTALCVAGEFAESEDTEEDFDSLDDRRTASSLRNLLSVVNFPLVAAARLRSLCRDARWIVAAARPAEGERELFLVRRRVVNGFLLEGFASFPEHESVVLRRMCRALARWPLAEDDVSEGAILAREAFALVLPWVRRPVPDSPSASMLQHCIDMNDNLALRSLVWPDEFDEEEEEEYKFVRVQRVRGGGTGVGPGGVKWALSCATGTL